MNRYLFRGKPFGSDKWVIGGISFMRDTAGIITEYKEDDKGAEIIEHYADPETICQCTGLKDKNGNVIFEGDILEILDYAVDYDNPIKYTAQVVFGNPHAETHWGWNLIFKNNANCLTDILCWIEMEESQVYSEIIGNIHDNKEFLKEEN